MPFCFKQVIVSTLQTCMFFNCIIDIKTCTYFLFSSWLKLNDMKVFFAAVTYILLECWFWSICCLFMHALTNHFCKWKEFGFSGRPQNKS